MDLIYFIVSVMIHTFSFEFRLSFISDFSIHLLYLFPKIKLKRNKNNMYFPIKFIFLLTLSPFSWVPLITSKSDPIPSPWPHQFHATTIMNYTGGLRKVDLWYDWPNKRYLHINQYQLGKKLYDVEWDNGTSFYFTLDSTQECTIRHFPVGILRPNWLEGANYLGQRDMDGFLCNVWEKADFIRYYEDVVAKIPVYWQFYDGLTEHIMTFEVGKVLEDSKWQAPAYCFKEMEKGKGQDHLLPFSRKVHHNGFSYSDTATVKKYGRRTQLGEIFE